MTIIWRYRNVQVMITIRAIHNLIAYKLLNTYIGVLPKTYCHQTINNFKKLLDLDSVENTSLIIIPILVVICMQIGLILFLENWTPNVSYNLDETIIERLVIV